MSNVASSVVLKNLQSQKTEAQAELKMVESERRGLDDKIGKVKARLKSLDRQITELKDSSATPVVSEHAMLRYFERVLGYDLEEIKKQILSEKTIEQIRVLRSGRFPATHNGFHFKLRVKDRVVITVLTDGEE